MTRLLLAEMLLPALCGAADLPLVGIDANGKEVERLVSRESYVKRLKTLIASVEQTAFPVLGRIKPMDGSWKLQTFSLGIAMNLTVGIGPILSVGLSPSFTFIFSNNTEPQIP